MQGSNPSDPSSESLCSSFSNRTIQLSPIETQLQQVFLKVYESAQTILSEPSLDQFVKIAESLGQSEQSIMDTVESALLVFLSEIETLKSSSQSVINQKDYEVLEQALQKAESEIRNHIRMEQQLKLYVDGIEEKAETLEKQLRIEETKYSQIYQSVKALDLQRKQLKREIKRLQEKLNRTPIHEKVRSHKSTKVLPQNQSHTVVTYKSKGSIQQIHRHKDKVFEKSQSNQMNMSRQSFGVIMPRKSSQKHHRESSSSRKRDIDDRINVDISRHSEHKCERVDKAENYVPTQDDIRIFREMTKTVQMKDSYKRPVRKNVKYKTEGKESQSRELKVVGDNRGYKSVSTYH